MKKNCILYKAASLAIALTIIASNVSVVSAASYYVNSNSNTTIINTETEENNSNISDSDSFGTTDSLIIAPIVGDVCENDPATNLDIYETYLEQGIDITEDKYKTMQPQLQLRNSEGYDDLIEQIGLIPSKEEDSSLYNTLGEVNWDIQLNRGQYARIINKFLDYYQIPDQPCCCTDETRDLSETPETSEYYEDVVKAAKRGFYCCKDGSDTSKPFTERELIKYLNKITSDLEISDIYNNIYTDEMLYNTLLKLNYCLDDEPDTTKNTLINLSKYNMLPIDSFYRVNLDRNLTLKEFAHILAGVGDMIVIYQSPEVKAAACKDCLLYHVDLLYDTYVPPVKVEEADTEDITEDIAEVATSVSK